MAGEHRQAQAREPVGFRPWHRASALLGVAGHYATHRGGNAVRPPATVLMVITAAALGYIAWDRAA